MAAPKIRSDYDQLNHIGQRFGQEGESTRQLIQSLRQNLDTLRGGDWIGPGATAFYSEMDGSVMPSLKRLAAAMDGFRPNDHSEPLRLPFANPQGDEIDRLGAAFQQLAERIATQLAQLQRHDEQQRELLTNVSHDLRTPLAIIQGYAQLLANEPLISANPDTAEYLATIVVLIVMTWWEALSKRIGAPAALGKGYMREEK